MAEEKNGDKHDKDDGPTDKRLAKLLKTAPPDTSRKRKGIKAMKAIKVPPREHRQGGPAGDDTAEDLRADAGQEGAAPERGPPAPLEAEAHEAAGTAEATGAAGLAPPVNRQESKDFMKAVQRQQRLRRRQEEEEAQRLQEQAKELLRRSRRESKRHEQLEKHQDWVGRMADDLGFDPDRPITEVPPLPDGFEQVDFHAMKKGRAYVRILYDNKTNSYLYETIEPRLNRTEEEIREFLRETLVKTMEGRQGRGDEDWEEVLLYNIQQAILDHSILIDEISTQRIQYHLVRDFLGYGPIDPLMLDPMLEDISCDGPGIPVYVFHRAYESMKTNVVFEAEEVLDSYVIRLAQRSGKHISIAEPLLDATLPDGSRLQTTLSKEVTTRGSSFTIRKFRTDPFTPPDLVQYGTMDARMAAFFWLVIEHGFSLIMAGGTASGKTTTLNAICQFIPPERKVVSIEDTREINLTHENWIAGVTRSGFGGQIISGRPAGEIGMYKLLEAALRQRPEYLLVGEVRGAEALTLFQAMATGHTVYSTMHADSVASAVYRLENPPIGVPRLMLQTLDVMAIQGQVRTGDRMVRRIMEVTEIVGFDPETRELLTNTVFRFDPQTGEHVYLGKSALLEHVMTKRNLDDEQMEKEWDDRVRILEWLLRHGVRDFRDVARIVTEYYQHPKRVVDRLLHGPEAQDPLAVLEPPEA